MTWVAVVDDAGTLLGSVHDDDAGDGVAKEHLQRIEAWVPVDAPPQDALAMTLLVEKGFRQEDFANLHPGGKIGKRLMRVEALMHGGRQCPIVRPDTGMRDVIYEMSSKQLGMTCVVDGGSLLLGIITDGDLRRSLQKDADVSTTRVSDVMSRGPRSIRPEALAAEAVQIMEAHKVNQLLVVDGRGELVGALNMHDLFRAKVI